MTFRFGDQIRGVVSTYGHFVDRCLVALQPGDVGPVRWGPKGDRVLLGTKTFIVNDNRTVTAFSATDLVTWSAPKGTALLRLDPTSHQLSKRNNLDSSAITNFDATEVDDALYHPAGRAVVFVGRPTSDSTYGIWLMSNEGADPRLITKGEDAQRIRLLGWDEYGGSTLRFWAQHLDGSTHVHILNIIGLGLGEDGGVSSVPELSALKNNDSRAEIGGTCAEGSLRLAVPTSTTNRTWPGHQRDKRAVKVLDDNSAIVATRDAGCEGPEDLWWWQAAPTSNAPVLLAHGVTDIAMRLIAAAPNELPDDITARAPG